ncbi:TraM recognition domain-containing protein [Ralstonia mannitolilytica]|uniref:TraM recognition domain-containing protein n=1 Tax=Ralstonia mannitolilytica TaxID=105219 RepID=UPI001C98400D|nr:TraM recognition domain-containing protein [Ralstonia mannitolilytica]MBY4717553.1 TraM recognition domain-containing protein [Ralstonia mannitolilytica]
MNNSLNLFQIFHWLGSYIFYGKIIIIFMILTAMYFKGKATHAAIEKSKEEKKFDSKKYEFSPALGVFNGTNKALDFILGKTIGCLHALRDSVWGPLTELLDTFIPDSMVKKVLTKLGMNFSFKHRVDLAQQHFDESQNAFWWNKTRAIDFRNRSPVISGKWFNGKPVEDYLPYLISQKTIYRIIKNSVIVFLTSFVIFAVIYKPQVYIGWLAPSTKQALVKDIAEKMVANPSLVPEFRKDFWNAEEQAAVNSQVQQMAEPFAARMINNAQGYNYYWFGFLFKNGLLTDLFISLAIAAFFIRRSYYKSYKSLHIPYIADSHEIAGYEKKVTKIDTHKRALSAANKRATNYDRKSPLIAGYISTGLFEKKGVIGALPAYTPIYQSILDKSQNTAGFGGTGSGKTELLVKPEIMSWFHIKNMYYNQQQAYNEIFDPRLNQLTPKAIAEGYLDTYRPLPDNPMSVSLSMMDIKGQIWKDLIPFIEEAHLSDDFIKIGAGDDQYSVDPLANVYDASKLRDILNSIMSQLGSKDEGDFWNKKSKQLIEKFADLAILYHRTTKGYKYMTREMTKIWSLMFIYRLVCLDNDNHLLSHCVYSIFEEAELHPERMADVLTEQRVQSIQELMTNWLELSEAKETQIGMKANMNSIMSDYSNDKLRPFLTGLGNNVIEIKEFWRLICAFDFPMEKYSTTGKTLLLMIKTLIFEEAVNRQSRFATRVIEISDFFKEAYPNLMVAEASVEAMPVLWLSKQQSVELLAKYQDRCEMIMEQLSKDKKGNFVKWESGHYQTELKKIVSKFPDEPTVHEYHEPMTAEILENAKKALEVAGKIRDLEPRFAEIKKSLEIAIVDGSMFNSLETDSEEVKKTKREHMALFYEYQDAKTRIKREHMLFLGDEYQELITLDKSGGCMSDYNFWNIARSTNTKGFLLTQTINAYEMKIGKEPAANFLNQMRTQIYLSTEDKTTSEAVSKLAGVSDVFESPLLNKTLKDNGKDTDFIIYDNFNAYISSAIETNKNLQANKQPLLKEYPYTENIFANGESIEVKDDGDFSQLFSSIFNKKEAFDIPSMKNHFLDEKGIKEYKAEGSDATGVRSNSDQIQDGWARTQDEMENKYQAYLRDGFRKDAYIISESDFNEQSNVHGFIVAQRAGMVLKEQVIVAPDHYYKEAD